MLSDVSLSFDHRSLEREQVIKWIISTPWGQKRTPSDISVAFDNSIVGGAYLKGQQVAVIRIVTDKRFFAYIADLFVAELHRRRGIGLALIEAAMKYPDCEQVDNWMVTTRDASGYFRKYGFRSIDGEKNLVIRRAEFLRH